MDEGTQPSSLHLSAQECDMSDALAIPVGIPVTNPQLKRSNVRTLLFFGDPTVACIVGTNRASLFHDHLT